MVVTAETELSVKISKSDKQIMEAVATAWVDMAKARLSVWLVTLATACSWLAAS